MANYLHKEANKGLRYHVIESAGILLAISRSVYFTSQLVPLLQDLFQSRLQFPGEDGVFILHLAEEAIITKVHQENLFHRQVLQTRQRTG